MNRQEANELRASMGLAPLPAVANDSRKKQARNQAARAAACRDLKGKRNKGGK